MSILSPIKYFGNFQPLIKDIFSIIGSGKVYDCFYDLFAGSAVVSLAAIKENLAKKYVINDAYPPLVNIWQQIYKNPEELIQEYKFLLAKTLAKGSEQSQQAYFDCLKIQFNELQLSSLHQAAYLAFLLNHTATGMLYIKNDKLDCHLSLETFSQDRDGDLFASCVRKVHKLFHKPDISIQFTNRSFTDFIPQITSNDFIFADPPFPDAEASCLYYRPIKKEQLRNRLNEALAVFTKKKTEFIMFYSLYELNTVYRLSKAQGHLIRCFADALFGPFLVNMYVSQSFLNKKFPSTIVPYARVKNFSVEEIIASLT